MAHTLISEGLAACVSIVPAVRSIYVFEGKLCDEGEVLCIAKTTAELYPLLQRRVLELHPYKVPEVIAFAIAAGNPDYLEWVRNSTRNS